MNQRRVNFHTLGCKLNFSESSTLARRFEEGGFVRVGANEQADICVVNTCSVTEHADKKCRNLIRKLHRRNPQAIIAVTGCYAQLKPYEIAEIEGVDIVLSNNDKGDLYKRVVELSGKGDAQVYSCATEELTRFFAAFSSGDRTRAFLKVQDGCDYCCSYCTIHYARGSSRNMPIADIVAEARRIAEAGQKEIVITGVNTGDFGRTTGERFIDLLRALDEVEGIERYRISSIEPNLLTDEIIAFCAASPKFQHHFHIPLQSGCDRILGLMRRRYTTARFAERIAEVRRLMPDAFIGIDVIVGFPTESDADFRETYEFLERIAPAFLHIFPFSVRPGTPAAEMSGRVQPSVATARVEELERLCGRLHGDFCARGVGREDTVLFESTMRGGMMFGYTGNYLRVKAPYDRECINKICRVRMTGIDDAHDLTAEIVGE
ncbi:MAG: tRNA (N(6)-L-threonylcarbamoyladenosine(37)-C(2))-methylthiotransferase MtaB [Alistipes sp.]|nr:tRNA (N(6)-L-threonylcarbamoyladenosine(37)-C(2))-methylthiotransferase MtaB [Alistipes sp.]